MEINDQECSFLQTVNPQVPGSSPGRGARIQKPADESLRAFLLMISLDCRGHSAGSNFISMTLDLPLFPGKSAKALRTM